VYRLVSRSAAEDLAAEHSELAIQSQSMVGQGEVQLQTGMRRFLSACAFVLIAFSFASASARPQKQTLSFSGEKRTYYLFAPSALVGPAPLILLLHGSGHDGMSLIEPWEEIAEREGIILVAPDSVDPQEWDYRKDSADFLHAVLDEVEARISVDTRRIYLFGHSGGAMYALYLSIVESEYFAATAIHAGALRESNFKLIDAAKRKIPISIWEGTNDASFPLSQVVDTQHAFNKRGFNVQLHELAGHDHNYYAISDRINEWAWQFMQGIKLDRDPDFYALSHLQYPLFKIESKSVSDLELTQKTFDRSVWASAKPYLDDPLPQLIAGIPELRGLEAAQDQQVLAELLKKTGAKSLDLLKKMPNVISHEKVVTELGPGSQTWQQEFEYLVLRHDSNGVVTLDEYRTDKANSGTAPLAQGLANDWVLFHPGNLAESRFRYLGRQRMGGHSTLVVAFAQIPDNVKYPGQVNLQGTSVPVIFQGVAWIDESDFRIVRLRKDLLTPRPDIYLRSLSSDILFSQVHVSEAPEPLWLPQEAKIKWDFKGQVVEQLHRYSGFRLYRTKSKIVM
jgi:predicted esterase